MSDNRVHPSSPSQSPSAQPPSSNILDTHALTLESSVRMALEQLEFALRPGCNKKCLNMTLAQYDKCSSEGKLSFMTSIILDAQQAVFVRDMLNLSMCSLFALRSLARCPN
jgi:hypothetical protein